MKDMVSKGKGRLLGLDYGEKFIGVAVSDGLGITAQGLGRIVRRNPQADLDKIRELIKEHRVEKLIVGLPRRMDGTLGTQAEAVMKFIEKLRGALGMEVEPWDERLTTVEAERAMIRGNLSRSKRKRIVDKLSAVLILQSYLDHLHFSLQGKVSDED